MICFSIQVNKHGVFTGVQCVLLYFCVILYSKASRTFSDLTQYPIFPWVIGDYTSDVLGM